MNIMTWIVMMMTNGINNIIKTSKSIMVIMLTGMATCIISSLITAVAVYLTYYT